MELKGYSVTFELHKMFTTAYNWNLTCNIIPVHTLLP